MISVSNDAAAQTTTWKLSATPTLTIGTEGDANKEFQSITGIARANNGDIVVVNEGSHNIRVFDASGKFLRAYGRQGSGPGEFEYARLIGRSGDTLFIFDPRNRRVSTVLMNTGYRSVRALPSIGDQATLTPLGRLNDGGMLVQSSEAVRMEHRGGTYRDTVRTGIELPPPSQALVSLPTVPRLTYFAFNPTNGPRAQSVGVYRFGTISYFVASGDAVWYGSSDSGQLQLFDHTGKLVAQPKLPWEPRAFNETAVNAARQQAIQSARSDASKAYMQALYDVKYRPHFEPLFGTIVAGYNGGAWVARFNADPKSPADYVVFDNTGKLTARITLPARFTPREIGPDYVVGTLRDDEGIETVAMYKLVR